MRRILAVLAACAAFWATWAIAGTVDRFVLDLGSADAGVLTPALAPIQVLGQTQFKAVDATCTAGTCTRAAPSASTEGLALGDISAFAAEACVVNGDGGTGTFSGAGTAEIWTYDPDLPASPGRWTYVIGKDFTFTDASSRTCVRWPNELAGVRPAGWRVVVRLNGVTVSPSIAKVYVKISGCLKQGCGF